jgi:hypothetical protein
MMARNPTAPIVAHDAAAFAPVARPKCKNAGTIASSNIAHTNVIRLISRIVFSSNQNGIP